MSRAPLVLFTPGPVRTPPLVNEYLADPPCNYHRQDGFTRMFAATERSLKRLVGLSAPDDWFATVMTSTGTAANEAALQALAALGPGVVLSNGFFGDRLVDQAAQDRLPHLVHRGPTDRPLDAGAVDAFLAGHPELRWCFLVSHETRMGLKNPLAAIGRLARRRGLLVGADVISSAFAYPIDLEGAGLDLAVTSSAKAIMGVPGLGIVFVRLASLPALAAAPRSGYYLDLCAETRAQMDKRQPRFAQPVALHAALHGACLHLERIGVDAHMARIQRQMAQIIDALASIGIRPQLAAEHRSNVAVNFDLPAGVRYPEFARQMEEQGYYLLYGIPGDTSHFQVSTIGDLCDDHVAGLSTALLQTLAPRARRERCA